MANLKNITLSESGFFSLPKGTTSNRPTMPEEGMVRFNEDYNEPEYFSDSLNSWVSLRNNLPLELGETIEAPALSAKQIKENFPDKPDGFYYIQNENMASPQQVWCDMTTDGGGWMLLWLQQGGPLEQQNVNFYTVLNGSSSSNLSPYRFDSNFDFGTSPAWGAFKNESGLELMKQYNVYNSSGTRIDYRSQDTNADGLNHYMSQPSRQVYDKLDLGRQVTPLDIYSTSPGGSPTTLTNEVSLYVDQGSGGDYLYGSTRFLTVTSTSRGFSNPLNQDGASTMQGWGARHWIAYQTSATNYSILRCQYRCWSGSENVRLEIGVFAREQI